MRQCMTAAARQAVRKGRPRIVLAQACPQKPTPSFPEVHGGHLKEAEAKYLERKTRELAFTNMRNDFPYRPARRHGEPDQEDIFYPDIQSYRRMELRRRGSAAVDRLWALADSHCYYHLVLNVRSTRCRLHHAQRLQDVRRYIWWRISKVVTGHVRSLHLDASRYPHWDHVLALPVSRESEFNDVIRELNRQIHGTDGPGDVRIWTKRILRRRRHVERTVDYCLRTRRYDRDPTHEWFEESFRADAYGGHLGISRRRIVRFKRAAPEKLDPEPSASIPSPKKSGRPPKRAGPAYRQRKRPKTCTPSRESVTN